MKRAISKQVMLTLEQAREMYCSDNAKLRDLALSVYTESELLGVFNYIRSKVGVNRFSVKAPSKSKNKIRAITDLMIVAEFLNDGWERKSHELAFCIRKYNDVYSPFCHRAKLGGTIYFKDETSTMQAIDILGKEKLDVIFG